VNISAGAFTPRLIAFVLAPFAAGYFLSYMFRAINAVVAPNLATELDLDAGQLGFVTAAYLIAFALFQLPLGMLLDRYGPRRVQTVLLTTAALGAAAFAMAESVLGLALARALIGLGFAGGLMAGFKAVVIWFAPARHALANASIMSVGGLGMLAATLPAEFAVQTIGWRGLFYVSAGVTAAVAIGIYFIVPERDDARRTSSLSQQLADIKFIYSDKFFWRIAPLVALTSGAHVGIHTLWAGPWFRDIGGLDRDGVALYLLIIAVAFLVGTLGAGFVADRLGRRGVDAIHIMIVGLGLFMLSQVAIIAELTVLNPLIWTVFGMTGQLAMLAYPKLVQHFGVERSGRAQTSMNLLLFAMAFFSQWVIGAILDLYPQTTDQYAAEGYRSAFVALLTAQVLALGWYFVSKAQPRTAG